jgi:outer membrane protein with beta-barrel domain
MRCRLLMGVVGALFITGSAYAQETGAGAGRVEIGAFPGGGMFFTQSSGGNEPDFGNYALGASFTVNLNRWIGIEGEGGATVGLRQNFNVGPTAFTDQRTPSMWSYSGNLVVNPAGSDRSLVPYATAGLGGLTMCPCGDAENLGVTTYETYLAGNVGGGLKWFSTRHFGLRGDYRFFMVGNKDSAPAFFGSENRYGHRVQAGVIFTY